ncbi:MAG: hypothetical protein ACK58L_00955 [Planctomycetota bacterium]
MFPAVNGKAALTTIECYQPLCDLLQRMENLMSVTSQTPPVLSNAPRISSRPDGMQGRSSSAPFGRELTAMGILTALRRRWVPAMAVAIPSALLAAAAVWELIPANYQSAAILKIDQNEARLIEGAPRRESDFHTYRESQKNYMLSRQVITAALRDPKVAECPTLKRSRIRWTG